MESRAGRFVSAAPEVSARDEKRPYKGSCTRPPPPAAPRGLATFQTKHAETQQQPTTTEMVPVPGTRPQPPRGLATFQTKLAETQQQPITTEMVPVPGTRPQPPRGLATFQTKHPKPQQQPSTTEMVPVPGLKTIPPRGMKTDGTPSPPGDWQHFRPNTQNRSSNHQPLKWCLYPTSKQYPRAG